MSDKSTERRGDYTGEPERPRGGAPTSPNPSLDTRWREAVRISLILAAAQVFTAFLTLYDLTRITADPASFAFDLFKFAGASFFGTFIALTGLAKHHEK